ncbi:hypothetical protein ACFONN_02675 [Dyella humi]|uniref:Lipoprotein n=1 Tax=Dyella humi TaxID=1770547 RepID=A0ABW8IH69_9GAMM
MMLYMDTRGNMTVSKTISLAIAATLLAACQASTSQAALGDVAAAPFETAARPAPISSVPATEKGAAISSQVPPEVEIYATKEAGAGQKCMVGAETDEDGMNEKPVVYLSDVKAGFVWHVSLSIPADTYQGRATHCVASTNALFVLVQSDTQPQQSLSQTLLQVVKLDRKSGAVLSSRGIEVPNIFAAHTSWVEKGDGNFVLDGNSLIVMGRYELLSDRDNSSKKDASHFSVNISQNLSP